jgi:hypothetical protein
MSRETLPKKLRSIRLAHLRPLHFAKDYLKYMVHVMPYTYIMTDMRPKIMTVAVKIYEKA